MRNWDLHTGAAGLEAAMDSLQAARNETTAQWDDETNRKFQEDHLAPLEPNVRRALDAIARLALLLDRAARECGPR